MRFLGSKLGFSFVGLMVVLAGNGAFGVTGRNANNSNMVRAGTQRMPTMPTMSIGNISPTVTTPTTPVKPITPVTPDNPDTPDEPDTPDTPDEPDTPDTPTPECSDGGVKNSDYTVDLCMRDVLSCVNGGALPNGMNDLFNEDLRNSIFNGMGLCASQVDKCISTVRKNCAYVYKDSGDVWRDFNARKIQPEYYNFVLRKTGLTPYQAENTCLLLDRNTYGASFAAVAQGGGNVTAEYDSKVGAYNNANGGGLSKNNPQGVQVNTSGIDGDRGHYARWDATNAECLVRVAAYNKDTQIKNSWLFGGDERLAEVWQSTGSTFVCGKDLFEFGLYTKTRNAAVIGVGGGTLLGAGIGAIAGHGKREFDCSRKSARETLIDEVRKANQVHLLNMYLNDPLDANTKTITEEQCNAILDLNDRYHSLDTAVKACMEKTPEFYLVDIQTVCKGDEDDCTKDAYNTMVDNLNRVYSDLNCEKCEDNCEEVVKKLEDCAAKVANNRWYLLNNSSQECKFKSLGAYAEDSIYCKSSTGSGCKTVDEAQNELNVFKPAVATLDKVSKGEEGNRLKTTLVGAGIGAGAGGVATAITAMVEKNNINCRVGDGLEKVAVGKSHTINTLRDFYVKWNLNLPDIVAPTALVKDCSSWRSACGEMKNKTQCLAAQINYKPSGSQTITIVPGACTMSGSLCIENNAVATSYGACGGNPVGPVQPSPPLYTNGNEQSDGVVQNNAQTQQSDNQWYNTWGSPL